MGIWAQQLWAPDFWTKGFWAGMVGYSLSCQGYTQPALCFGHLRFDAPSPDTLRTPRVTAKSIDWLTVVRQAEGPDYNPHPKYPAYQFGGGSRTRIFWEDV